MQKQIPQRPQPNIDKVFRWIFLLAATGVTGNLLFSLWTIDRASLQNLVRFDPRYLILAAMLSLVPWAGHTLRCAVWTRFLGYRIRAIEFFKVAISTELVASVTPTAIGGGPLKVAMLVQNRLSPGAAACLTTLSTFEDVVFFLISVPIAVGISSAWSDMPIFDALHNPLHALNWTWVILTAILVGATGIILVQGQLLRKIPGFQRFRMRLLEFWSDFKNVYAMIGRRGKSRFMLCLCISGIQWTCRYSVAAALVASLGLSVEPVRFFALQWLVDVLAMFVPTPGAIGSSETLFYLLFQSVLPKEVLGIVIAGWRFLTFYFVLILDGILLYILTQFGKPKSLSRVGDLDLDSGSGTVRLNPSEVC
ncbi:MAG: lysylphosphatidylglycerol synthase transmembrane domain-containing protein [Candidatus Poribacteria bacterium]|nr:lysylphosphatidylglycerol synthase transmembrane domain-containing protein [Candidatus Poribacteria bacterium]